jgi:hypothetical protein
VLHRNTIIRRETTISPSSKPDISPGDRRKISMKTMILSAVAALSLDVRVAYAQGLAPEMPTASHQTAFAQAQTPTRIGNIWNWQDHQPTETQVQRDEKAAGIAPTPSQESSEAATLDQINRQLLH